LVLAHQSNKFQGWRLQGERTMKIRVLVGISLLMLTANSWADNIYLTCKIKSLPDYDLREAYKIPPALKDLQNQFLMDMIKMAMVGVIVNPSETWIVDTSKLNIHAPDESLEQNVFHSLSISAETIRGTTENGYQTFKLNRINGSLELKRYVDQSSIAKWKSEHGGTLPSFFTWTLQCVGAKNPAI
jgi:hypothetical protein